MKVSIKRNILFSFMCACASNERTVDTSDKRRRWAPLCGLHNIASSQLKQVRVDGQTVYSAQVLVKADESFPQTHSQVKYVCTLLVPPTSGEHLEIEVKQLLITTKIWRSQLSELLVCFHDRSLQIVLVHTLQRYFKLTSTLSRLYRFSDIFTLHKYTLPYILDINNPGVKSKQILKWSNAPLNKCNTSILKVGLHHYVRIKLLTTL